MDAFGHNVLTRLFRQIVSADFNVIHEDVGVIDGSRELVRQLHLAIDDELDMMSTRWKLEDRGEDIGFRAMGSHKLALLG